MSSNYKHLDIHWLDWLSISDLSRTPLERIEHYQRFLLNIFYYTTSSHHHHSTQHKNCEQNTVPHSATESIIIIHQVEEKNITKKKNLKFGNKSKHFSHSKRVSKFTHQIQIQQNKNAFEIVYSHSISNATHNKQQTTSSLAVAIIVLLLVLGPPSHVARWDSQKTWIQQIHA